MSTLRVTNIQDESGGNSATTAQIYNGIAKAWIKFRVGTVYNELVNGSIVLGDDFNITSITDGGVGDYTLIFTNSLPNINYSVLITCTYDSAINQYSYQRGYGHPVTYSTNSVRIRTGYDINYTDQDYVNVAIFR